MTRRRVLGVEGVEHQAPIPQAVLIGGMLFSSAIFGADPATGALPPDPDRQAELVFAHVRAILAQAGADPSSIGKMSITVADDAHRESVNREWLRMFPDADDRPARHIVRADLRRGMLVQCEFIAVVGAAAS